MKIVFPWFPTILNPNNHPSTRRGKFKWTRAKNAYKREWYVLTLQSKAAIRPQDRERPIPVKIFFHPPDRRLRDVDNCVIGIKYGMDGMAAALGVNDRFFVPSHAMTTKVLGAVEVWLPPLSEGGEE